VISAFVASYGYLAVLVGTLLEGESILIAAGFAAHRGLLDLPTVILVAMLGGTLGDQLAFLLGRWKGDALIERFPLLARHKLRVHGLLERNATLFILTVRFLYGLRLAGPMLLGSSRIPLLRFAVLNSIGAALWATVVSSAGYVFGIAINALIPDLRRIEEVLLAAILLAGGVVWICHKRRMQRRGALGN
jgi:membrane protein DedA with SNARE-associated domain